MKPELLNLNNVLTSLYQNIKIEEELSGLEENDKKKINLTLSEVHTLEVISDARDKSITGLSQELKITPGTFSVCVDKLIKKGYIKRINDDLDKRKVLIDITSKSIPILDMHSSFHEKLLLYSLDTLKLDINELTKSLEKINNYIEEMSDKNE